MEANFKDISDAYKMIIENTSDKTVYGVFNYKPSKRTYKGGKKRNKRVGNEETESSFIALEWIDNIIISAFNSSNFIFTLRSKLFKLAK